MPIRKVLLVVALAFAAATAAAAQDKLFLDPIGDALPEGAIMRLGTVRLRHNHEVTCVAWSANGKMLASAGVTGEIHLWNPTSGDPIRVFTGPDKKVCSLAWSPDGKTLAAAMADKTIRLWDPENGKEIHSCRGHADVVTSVAWSPDGKTLASSSDDSTVRFWDPATAKETLDRIDHPQSVAVIAWSPDGKSLSSGCADGKVRIFDGKEIRICASKENAPVLTLAWSRDSKIVASGDSKSIRLWNASSGKETRSLKIDSPFLPPFVNSLSWSPDGKVLASATGQRMLQLWDPDTGTEIRSWAAHREVVNSVAWSPDGKTLASAGNDNAIFLWDPATGKESLSPPGHRAMATSVAWSPNGKTLATTGHDGTVRLWNPATGKELQVLRGHEMQYVWSVAWSPDGKYVATAASDETVRTWDSATGKQIHRIDHGDPHYVWSVAWSPDGKKLASSSGNEEHVHVWDAITGDDVGPFDGSSNFVAWSPDSRFLASAEDKREVCVWDTVKRTAVFSGQDRDHHHEARSVAWSPDGRTLAAACDNTIRLWDLASAQEIRTFKGHEGVVRSVAWSPDGRTLASASDDGTIRLWSPATGKQIRLLAGSSDAVRSVAFSPDGLSLASAHVDATILIWKITSPPLENQRLADSELPALWADLAANKASKADHAMWALVAGREQSLPFLKEHLPATRKDPKLAEKVDRLIADLDSEDFNVRERASTTLAKLGAQAETALKRTLAADPSSAEQRRRIEALLQVLAKTPWPGMPLQDWRALAVLEWIGNDDARSVLESLSNGDPDTRLTQEAKNAMKRFQRRKSP
jgi:WD40 repeat protein